MITVLRLYKVNGVKVKSLYSSSPEGENIYDMLREVARRYPSWQQVMVQSTEPDELAVLRDGDGCYWLGEIICHDELVFEDE